MEAKMKAEEQVNNMHDLVQMVALLICDTCGSTLKERGVFSKFAADDLADKAYNQGWRFSVGSQLECQGCRKHKKPR
jgi:hypothetical protein